MNSKVLAAALGLTLLLEALPAQRRVELLGETNPLATLAGNRFQGLWWFEAAPGSSPIILTISSAGIFELHTAVDNGAYLPFELSEMRGVWRRTGGREAQAIALRFTYNLDGTINTLVRAKVKIGFGEDFDTLILDFAIDQINCETVETPPGAPGAPLGIAASCPDVRTAPADAVRGGVVEAYRVPFDAGP